DEFAHQKQLVNDAFWSSESGTYAFALDKNNQKVIEPSVLATVPMWFGLLDSDHAASMLTQLAGPEHQTDWGMRIISSQSPRYDAGGYHYGSVWPLFTGWAAVGEYRYHRALPAYSNLRSNALLALDGSLGNVTEVLSGDYYQPLSTSSPHQIWSAAMVISAMLRGMLGLETDAVHNRFTLAPHVPAGWSSFAVHNVRAGSTTASFDYQRTPSEISLQVESSGNAQIEFSPAISPRAQVIAADVNGRRVPFQIQTDSFDQHPTVRVPIEKGKSTLRLRVANDFAVGYSNSLPSLGSPSRELHVISESWSGARDSLTLEVAGISGSQYELAIWNAGEVTSVDGGQMKNGKLCVDFSPEQADTYSRQKVTIHFTHISGRH
ncbi:MAG TPA: hypothetical protein VGU90_03215, partial [Terriglobales bacterium]|nr:hypothetical protein [Terriglobales bacterium]